MCLEVNANGWGKGAGTHVGIAAYLMKGEYDSKLEWPFCGSISIELLNTCGDHHHIKHTINFEKSFKVSQRVMKGERAQIGLGKATFISHSALALDSSSNTQYLSNNQLHFQISRATVYSSCLSQKLPQWCLLSSFSFITLQTMPEFTKHKLAGDIWQSNKFYTHHNGYCLYLEVHANGYEQGLGSHVGVNIRLAAGPYDDALSWPFIGAVTVQILNWRRDEQHRERTIQFTGPEVASTCRSRVITGDLAPSSCGKLFISHANLTLNTHTDTQYVDDDCLTLRVTSVKFPFSLTRTKKSSYN